MIYNNFTIYNNSSENSSKAIVHKTKEKKLWKLRKKTQINMKNLLIQ